ncbi:MAG: hypothetical protein JSS51_07665 [Planctomycetes bacterium]|nr:hypothetical protein [Planctomycetota bacterium]
MMVACKSTSTAPLLVNIPALHGSDWVEIESGKSVEFTAMQATERGRLLDKLNVKTASGTATYGFAVTFG